MKLCGKMDSRAAWVTAKGKVAIQQALEPDRDPGRVGADPSSDAGPSTVELELSVLEDVTTLYRIELLLARGRCAAGDVELSAAVETMAKSSMAESKLLPRLGLEGRVANLQELLSNMGVRLGSTAQAKSATESCTALEKGEHH